MSVSAQEYMNSLLGNDLFLKQFNGQLKRLYQDADFLRFVDGIRQLAEKSGCAFSDEKDMAKKAFYDQAVYFKFPDYKHIADTVKSQGYAKNSAAISTYCALRMMQDHPDFDIDAIASGQALSPGYEPDWQASSGDVDAERWNEICFLVNRYRSPSATERDFQIEAENIFEKLGWSRFKGEISSQVTIPVGSAQSVRPDIVISKDGVNVMVVELKKPAAGISVRNVDQLFSYMRLLRLDCGLLVGDTIQVYFDDPKTMDAPVQVIEIPFVSNSADGIELCRTISREGFTLDRLKGFAKAVLRRGSQEEQVAALLDMLCSSEGPTFVRQAMFQFFCEKYPPEVVNKVLDKIRIEVPSCGNKAESLRKETSSADDDEGYSGMKVGEIANNVLRPILEKGVASDEELSKMQGASYSKAAFDLNYPLLVRSDVPHERSRYYVRPLNIRGVEYKLCSQWFETDANNDRPYLLRWIREHR